MNRIESGGRTAPEIVVLLLEDDDADAYLTKRALMGIPRVSRVVRAKNGEEAVTFLASEAEAPAIGFVDLQMPKMNGIEFLDQCMDQRLANIPMVVLTSSSARNDLLRSRVHGALRVITKPESPVELQQALSEAINAFVPQPSPSISDTVAAANVPPQAAPSAEKSAAPTFGRRGAR